MREDKPFTPRDWESHPPLLHPDYKSTRLRAPTKPLVPLKQGLSEVTGPVFGQDAIGPLDHDLTRSAVREGEPLGERIIVTTSPASAAAVSKSSAFQPSSAF